MKRAPFFALLSLSSLLGGVASAQVTIPADPLPVEMAGAAGLFGSIYHDPTMPQFVFGADNTLSDYRAFSTSANLQATYVSTMAQTGLNYGNFDTTPVATFLGSDATTLTPSSYGTTQVQSTIFDLRGYINVTAVDLNTPFTFSTNSDDGSFILIDGITVVSNPGAHGPQLVTNTVTFTAAGLYPFEIVYGNQDFSNSTGGGVITTLAAPGNTSFVQVPEPSTVALAVVSAGGMIGLIRRRRR